MSAPRLMGAAFAALLASAAPALAQDMAVTNARLVIGDGTPPIDNGTVVVRGGKVVAAGAGVAVPADLKPIDVGGRWVTPGLVVAVTDLGLVDVEASMTATTAMPARPRSAPGWTLRPRSTPLPSRSRSAALAG